MRLTEREVQSIKNSFIKIFEHGSIFLFGSRLDDNQKGGDIDLYIVPAVMGELALKKINFLVSLKKSIGEQKIDVVIDRGEDRLIDKIAKKEGLLLCKN